MTNIDALPETPRDLAGRHEVWYEIWPDYSLSEGRQVQVGFALELCGLRDQAEQKLTPGDEASKITYSDLRRIASAVMPASDADTACCIQPFDHALHECSRRSFRPEVVLSVEISNRGPGSSLVGENDCLRVIEEKLIDLGVRGGHGSSIRRISLA